MQKATIQKIVNNFVDQLHAAFQAEAIEALTGTRPNGNGRGKGEKRSVEDLEQISAQFVAFVTKNPGLRIEQINKQLGTTTKDLALPIRKLLAEKKIKAKGKKRSTTYFA